MIKVRNHSVYLQSQMIAHNLCIVLILCEHTHRENYYSSHDHACVAWALNVATRLTSLSYNLVSIAF